MKQNWDLFGKKEKNELYSLFSRPTLKFIIESLYFDKLIFKISLLVISMFLQVAFSRTKCFEWRKVLALGVDLL